MFKKKVYYKILITIFCILLLLTVIDLVTNFYKLNSQETSLNFDIIKKNKSVELRINKSEYSIDKDIYIPSNTTLIIEPGTVFNMGENKRFIIDGRIIAIGTEEQPIVFKGDDDYWRGIMINGKEKGTSIFNMSWSEFEDVDNHFNLDYCGKLIKSNKFNYVIFENVSYVSDDDILDNRFKAVIEVYNSSIVIANSVFRNVEHMGAVQIMNSNGGFYNNTLSSNAIHKNFHILDSQAIIYINQIKQNREKQGCNDVLWLIKSLTLVSSNVVNGKGDDGIDIKGGYSYVLNNLVEKNKDDGIDLGEEYPSKHFLFNNTVMNNSENGIQVAMGSGVLVNNYIHNNTFSGLSLRNKGLIYSFNDVIKNNNEGVKLIFDITKEHEEYDGPNLTNAEHLDKLELINQNQLMLVNSEVTGNKLNQINNNGSRLHITNSLIEGGYESKDNLDPEFEELNTFKYTVLVNNINKKLQLFEQFVIQGMDDNFQPTDCCND